MRNQQEPLNICIIVDSSYIDKGMKSLMQNFREVKRCIGYNQLRMVGTQKNVDHPRYGSRSSLTDSNMALTNRSSLMWSGGDVSVHIKMPECQGVDAPCLQYDRTSVYGDVRILLNVSQFHYLSGYVAASSSQREQSNSHCAKLPTSKMACRS